MQPHDAPALGRHQMRLCGMSQADETFSFVRKRPRTHQILVSLSGSGRVLVDGAWHQIKTGEAYVTPAGIMHAYYAQKNWCLAWAIYDAAFDIPQQTPCVVAASETLFSQCIASLHQEVYGIADVQCIDAWVTLLHTSTCRLLGVEENASPLQRLWQEVAFDLSEGWTIAGLAARMGISEEHFRRLCHEEYKMSPQAYLLELRMQRAASLLSATSLNVGAIAMQVAYQNPFAFATAFKRWSGKSPSAYRKETGE